MISTVRTLLFAVMLAQMPQPKTITIPVTVDPSLLPSGPQGPAGPQGPTGPPGTSLAAGTQFTVQVTPAQITGIQYDIQQSPTNTFSINGNGDAKSIATVGMVFVDGLLQDPTTDYRFIDNVTITPTKDSWTGKKVSAQYFGN